MKSTTGKAYLNLHKKVDHSYKKKIKDILAYAHANSDVLNPELVQYLKKISKQSIHPLNFYLVEMLDDYLTIYEQTAEGETEEVFDYWSDSEFSQEFMKVASKTSDIAKASKLALKSFLAHINLYLDIHLLSKKVKNHKAYKLIKEIGDFEHKGKLLTVGYQEIKSIELSQGPNHYLSFICHDTKNKPKFLKKMSRALEMIRSFSPKSYERFCHFSHTIVPIKEKRVVSYSSQKLPGYSTINLYHRDFVDLMDDLIHENGHHHLNTYLNHTELIHEDNDKIYYSPWRRALRPIRGIYHAVFTFYWGMELFKDLSLKLASDRVNIFKLSKEEKIKIHYRFVEEYLMLEYSFYDLKLAYADGKITKAGQALIMDLKKSFEASEADLAKSLKILKKDAPKKFKEAQSLKDHLKKMRSHYKI